MCRRASVLGALSVVIAASGCGGSATTTGTTTTTTTAAAAAPTEPEIKEQKAKEAAEQRAAAANAQKEVRKAAATKRAEARKERAEAAAKKLEESAGHGLGATKATFESNNTMTSTEGTEPPEGTDYYRITETDSHGRGTGYEVTIYASPPFSNQERIGLLGGVDLPNGTEPLPELEHSHCYVWQSAVLKRLIGKGYAEGTTESGTDTAQMQAVTQPNC
jgi:hypothetical protein